jgi:beta-glucuronidase
MKRIPTLILFLSLAASSLRGDNIPDLLLRPAQSLDGEWKTIIDPYETGFYDYRRAQRDLSDNPSRSETYYLDVQPPDPGERIEYDFDKSPTLQVPGDWNTQRPELLYYEGTLWYRRKFRCDAPAAGEKIFLRFGAANYRADVYLNGKRLGTHIGGFTPFSFDATSVIRAGENSLVVRVDNRRYREAVPTLNTDWWNYGGLTRSVTLVRVPQKFIAEHRLWLESETNKSISGWLQIAGAGAGEKVSVDIPELQQSINAETDPNGRAAFRFTAPNLQLWNPGQPKLYTVKLSCGGDSVSEPIGFRTVRASGRQILVNGRPVFLRGICIHEEFPLQGGGRVKSPAQAEELLKWAKELGCNFVRLAHYPHNEAMTRLADQIGIMVWSEVPVYWTIDWTNRETLANAQAQLTDEIRRDANLASIIIWSIANETPVSKARTKFLADLATTARALDSTRLLSAAMEQHSKPGDRNVKVLEDPLMDIVDVVSFNQYVGWYLGLPPDCEKARWEITCNKPVFVSEYGGDARAGHHGDKTQRWTEEFQAELYRQTLPMLDKIEGLSGMSPWILADFRSPKRVLPGIQDGYNRKGLVSSDGAKKQAFFVLQDYYQKKAAAENAKPAPASGKP